MSVLVETHDPEVFGGIPELHDAIRNFKTSDALNSMDVLGKIFLKHNVYNEYGLTMVHRHFELKPNEILVETLAKDRSLSVAVPWEVCGENARPGDMDYWNSFDLKEEKYIIPQTWGFTNEGNLKAFEYLSIDRAEYKNPPPDFVSELFEQLVRLGLETILGLRRTNNLMNTSSWEVTPEGIRANILQFGDVPVYKDGVVVTWIIDAAGNVKGNAWCGVCTHSCGTCTH